MEKQLKMDEATARRLYPTAAPEFKEMLEQNFGKYFFKKDPYSEVCDYLGVSNDESGIKVDIEGFNSDETESVINYAKAVRISKFYRKGRLPKKGERRYYAWWYLDSSSPSGLRFDATSYDYDVVDASSAAHLCFFTPEDAKDAALKFPEVYSGFLGAKLMV